MLESNFCAPFLSIIRPMWHPDHSAVSPSDSIKKSVLNCCVLVLFYFSIVCSTITFLPR